jgi:hypothetical protein
MVLGRISGDLGLPLCLLAAVALSIATIGLPATLIWMGSWLYAALVSRWFTALSGPASWAAGIIVEVTILSGESFVSALMDPHSQSQWWYVTILMVPLAFGVLLYWMVERTATPRIRQRPLRVSAEPWLALVVLVLTLLMFEAIKLHGRDFGLTWAMNGDAKNHISINRTIIWQGGLTLHMMKSYPALVNALCSIVAGAGGRDHLPAGTLMVRDVQAMVSIIVLSCIAIGALFVAAISEMLPRVMKPIQRIPALYYVVLLGCATLGVGAYVLGLALNGGFLSAIGALALALTSVVLGLRMVRDPTPLTLTLLTVSLFLVVSSWTVLAVVPATGVMFGAGFLIFRLRSDDDRLRSTNRVPDRLAVAFATLSILAIAAELYLNRATLITTLKGYGGILPPNPGITMWVGVGCFVAFAISPSRRQRLIRLVALCMYVAGCAAALWLRHIEPHGVGWSYYSAKMLWLATSCTIWMPFVVVADAAQWIMKLKTDGRLRALLAVPVTLAATYGLVWFCTLETPFPVPLTWAYVGSTYPTPSEISLVINQANLGGPFVIWDFSRQLPAQFANEYNDQIGNFWSSVTWDYNPDGSLRRWAGLPYSFEGWAYDDTGKLPALCQVLENQTIRIVTSDRTLGAQLTATCPAYRAHRASDVISVLVDSSSYTNPL